MTDKPRLRTEILQKLREISGKEKERLPILIGTIQDTILLIYGHDGSPTTKELLGLIDTLDALEISMLGVARYYLWEALIPGEAPETLSSETQKMLAHIKQKTPNDARRLFAKRLASIASTLFGVEVL